MIEELLTTYLPTYAHNKYLFAAIVLVTFFILSKLVIYIATKIILKLTVKTKTKLDDRIVERTNGPISWLLLFIGIKIAIEFLDYQNGIADTLSKITNSLIYIATGIAIIAVVVALIDFWGKRIARRTKSSLDDTLLPLFRSSTKATLGIILGLMILSIWNVDITGLLAGVGIAGLAIGFAVKDSLANIFGGISLILDKTFHVGHKVALDDGTVGVIQDVGIRATRVKTYDNEILVVPNGRMANMIIKNFHLPDHNARVVVPIGIEYGQDPMKAKKVALEAIKTMKDIEQDPAPSARFTDMGDFSLTIKIFVWVDDLSKVHDTKEEIMTRVYNAFNKKKIGIAFPTQTVHVKKSK